MRAGCLVVALMIVGTMATVLLTAIVALTLAAPVRDILEALRSGVH